MTTELTQTTTQAMNILIPNGEALIEISQRRLASAQAIAIDSQDMADIAAGELRAIKSFAAQLEAERTELVGPLNEVVKKINAKYKPAASILADAETMIKRAVLTWNNEQQRKAQAEAARLRDEAAKAAAKLEVKAEKMEAKGKAEEAAALHQEAVTTVAVVQNLTTAPVKIAGVSTRDNWKSQCVDHLALVMFIAANPQYLDLIPFNQSAGDKLAKAFKDKANVPGVRIYNDPIISSRAA